MASIPQPVGRGNSRAIPAPLPTGASSSRTPAEIAASSSKISTLTSTGSRPRLLAPREKIHLLGDTVAGKSFAYVQEASDTQQAALEANIDPAHYWVVDTDDTMSKFIWPGYAFEHLSFTRDNGNMYPFPCFTLSDVRQAIKTIIDDADVPRGDWAVVDVVQRVYEYAQRHVALSSGKDLDDEWMARTNRGAGFGAFEGGDWNIVRRAFEACVYRLFDHWRGNVLLVQHIKPIVAHFDKPNDPKTKRREMMTLFGELGYKPDGAPNLVTAMDTVIVVWAVREPQGITGELKVVRKFRVLKDRGEGEQSPDMIFGRDLFQSFYRWRRTSSPVITVEDAEEAAEIEARVAANINAQAETNASAAGVTDTTTDTHGGEE